MSPIIGRRVLFIDSVVADLMICGIAAYGAKSEPSADPRATAYDVTYYVDVMNGSDSNSGTSPSAAWRTIAKVNSTTFAAGDHILFKRGETWRELLSLSSRAR